MRRARMTAGGLALVATASMWLAGSGVAGADKNPGSGTGTVAPILECVWHVANTNWLALWGYSNSSSSTQTIPVGSDNSFSPGAADQGQPTSFSPGTNDGVFTVPFVASDPPGWTLDGSTVQSSPSDKKCSDDPVPVIPGTANWTTALVVIFLALGILGVGFVLWRVDPELLALRRTGNRSTDRR